MIGEVDYRLTQVSEKLSLDLDRFLTSYRTSDRRELTEGEVMTALGRIIARKSHPSEKRMVEWLTAISIASQSILAQMKDQGV